MALLGSYALRSGTERALLYIHGSANNGNYSDLAKALCGDTVELIKAPDVFRVFSGINRLMLTNVGLDEQLGRQIRYTGRMGPDVGALLAEATLATTTKAVLAGVGFEKAGRPLSEQASADEFGPTCYATR